MIVMMMSDRREEGVVCVVHIGARLPSGPDDPAQVPFADAWRAFRGVQADLSRRTSQH